MGQRSFGLLRAHEREGGARAPLRPATPPAKQGPPRTLPRPPRALLRRDLHLGLSSFTFATSNYVEFGCSEHRIRVSLTTVFSNCSIFTKRGPAVLPHGSDKSNGDEDPPSGDDGAYSASGDRPLHRWPHAMPGLAAQSVVSLLARRLSGGGGPTPLPRRRPPNSGLPIDDEQWPLALDASACPMAASALGGPASILVGSTPA